MKYKLILEGLDCADCAAKIERAIAQSHDFENVSLVFATKSLYLDHSGSDAVKRVQEIVDGVEEGVTVREFKNQSQKEKSTAKNIPLYIAIVLAAGAVALDILSISTAATAALSACAIVLSGYKVCLSGVKALLKLRLDETTLMTIAVIAAFCLGQFAEGAMVTVLFGIGELLEDKAVEKSRAGIEALANIQPDRATVLLDGKEKIVEAEAVNIGSVIIVKPYERIPVDGVIIQGESAIDASAVTGESIPVDCGAGSRVMSGTVNGQGLIHVRTTKLCRESTANRIIKLVEESSAQKGNNEKLITRFASIYTPIVIAISLAVALIPPIFYGNLSQWVYRGLVCLVASCPCAIVISVPLSYYSGIGAGSRAGVLIKGGKYLEALARADAMVFDKTGTLTEGKPEIVNIIPYRNYTKDEILALAAACEKNSSHPIAKAILNACKGEMPELTDYREKSGYGVSAVYKGRELVCGSRKLLNTPPDSDATVFLIYDGELIGALEVSDRIRREAPMVIEKLKALGFKKTVMLTGDNAVTARKTARALRLTEYRGELLPQDKAEAVKELKLQSKGVCFVGDGINDSPVIAVSDCGIAMGLGSDAAIEASDCVLTADSLTALPKAVKIAKKTVSTVKLNIIFALLIKAAVIVLAFLGYAAIWMSVIADTGVCLLCVLFSARLLKIKSGDKS